eukprot:2423531-Pyramimonas_sp.AAC.1
MRYNRKTIRVHEEYTRSTLRIHYSRNTQGIQQEGIRNTILSETTQNTLGIQNACNTTKEYKWNTNASSLAWRRTQPYAIVNAAIVLGGGGRMRA